MDLNPIKVFLFPHYQAHALRANFRRLLKSIGNAEIYFARGTQIMIKLTYDWRSYVSSINLHIYG